MDRFKPEHTEPHCGQRPTLHPAVNTTNHRHINGLANGDGFANLPAVGTGKVVMATSRGLVLAVLLASSVGLTGCPGDSTHPAPATHPNAASVASPNKTHDLAVRR